MQYRHNKVVEHLLREATVRQVFVQLLIGIFLCS